MQDFATRSLTISEETPEVAMELLTEDAEVFIVLDSWSGNGSSVVMCNCCFQPAFTLTVHFGHWWNNEIYKQHVGCC